MSQPTKKIIVILGMARSGTSVISRALKALGVDLGEHLTPASKWNPRGFFEDNDIVYRVNEPLLRLLESSWESATFIDQALQTDHRVQNLKQRAIGIIQNRLQHHDIWAFKDPRSARLLAFWQAVFKEAQVEEQYVIALRNPLACASSYQRLTGTDLEHGLILWMIHLLSAINGTQHKKRILVNYDAIMHEPRLQLERLQTKLNIQHLANSTGIDEFINEFLDKNLKHFEHTTDELKSHAATRVLPLSVEMYNWLLKIANDQMTFEYSDFQAAWLNIDEQLKPSLPIYQYIDTLLQRNRTLQKYIRSLHKSRLWKLLYPLRKLDDRLRLYRKAHQHKKFID